MYRVGGDGFEGVLFAERDEAEYIAAIRAAMRESKTWGEFRAKLPDGEWENYFQEYFEGSGTTYEQSFSHDCAPGAADGDYPKWLLQAQLEWFPEELIEKYGGSLRRTILNGDALELPADKAKEMAADLRAMGHEVEETDLDIS